MNPLEHQSLHKKSMIQLLCTLYIFTRNSIILPLVFTLIIVTGGENREETLLLLMNTSIKKRLYCKFKP